MCLLYILHPIKVIGMIRTAPEKERGNVCVLSMVSIALVLLVFLVSRTEIRAMRFFHTTEIFPDRHWFSYMFLIKEIPFLRQYTGLECLNDYLSSKRENYVPALLFPRPNHLLSPRTYIYDQIGRPPYRNSFPFLKRE